MADQYTNSLIDSTKTYLYNLQYLASDDKITLRALSTLKIFHQIYNWADWFEVSEENKIAIEKLLNCLILHNSNLTLPAITPGFYYSNVSTPQTAYTWRSIKDDPDLITHDVIDGETLYTLTVQSENGTNVSIILNTPDVNNHASGTTTFTRIYQIGEVIRITAPPILNTGNAFLRWKLDGISQLDNQIYIDVTMNSNHTIIAEYEQVTAPTGTVTVNKIITNSSNVEISDDTLFEVTISNSNYSESGYIGTNIPLIFNNLPIGTYIIEETPKLNYTIGNVTNTSITITSNNLIHSSTITNIKGDDVLKGQLTINKSIVGAPLDATTFLVTIQNGTNIINGYISQGKPLVLTNLELGTYTITEQTSATYELVSIDNPTVTLSSSKLEEEVNIVNQEIETTGSLTINKEIQTTPGKGLLYNWYALFNKVLNIANGELYNWYAAVDKKNIASDNIWQVPLVSDWQTLITYLGGANPTTANKLRDTNSVYWDPSYTGATNEVGFNGRGSGSRWVSPTDFAEFGNLARICVRDDLSELNSRVFSLGSTIGSLTAYVFAKKNGQSVRLVRPATLLEQALDNGELIDTFYYGNDGQKYKCTKIGTQVWLAENLVETLYQYPSVILDATSPGDLSGDGSQFTIETTAGNYTCIYTILGGTENFDIWENMQLYAPDVVTPEPDLSTSFFDIIYQFGKIEVIKKEGFIDITPMEPEAWTLTDVSNEIPLVEDIAEWSALQYAGRCHFDNSYNNVAWESFISKLTPDGWHVATITELAQLHADNVVNPIYNLTLVGIRTANGTYGNWSYPSYWSSEERDIDTSYVWYNGSTYGDKNNGLPVRFFKDNSNDWQEGDYLVIDGESYRTIQLSDDSICMLDNLGTLVTNESIEVPIITDNTLWSTNIDGAVCAYQNTWENIYTPVPNMNQIFEVLITRDTFSVSGFVSMTQPLVLSNLGLGTYTITEVEHPSYDLISIESPIELTSGTPNKTSEIINFENEIDILGTIIVNKSITGLVESPEVFAVSIRGTGSNNLVQTKTISIGNPAIFSNLPLDTYTITELENPDFPFVSMTPDTCTLTEEDPSQIVAVVNEVLIPTYGHGYLYNWYAINNSDPITNIGWVVPDPKDYLSLIASFGGEEIAGGSVKLPGYTYWKFPNYGATNSSKFNATGDGVRGGWPVQFSQILEYTGYWTTGEMDSTTAPYFNLRYNDEMFLYNIYNLPKTYGFSARIRKISTNLEEGESSTYIGNDGKSYQTICIGGVEWLAENLKETKYRSLANIPNITSDTSWGGLRTGALCAYNNDINNV